MSFMNKKQCYILISLLTLVIFNLSAQTQSITLGGREGWKAFSYAENITTGEGKFGYESIRIDDGSHQVTAYTDLLLNFENGRVSDISGNYSVIENNMFTSEKSIKGDYGGVSRGVSPGLSLEGNAQSLFGRSGITGSFSISFWIFPSIAANGEQIISWRSSRTIQQKPLYQLLTASIYKNRMEWQFTNIFNAHNEDKNEFFLRGRSTIVPEVWSRHTLSYDADSGTLEYYMNGKLEGITYVTSNGEQSGMIQQAEIGVPADLDICSQYVGSIDDFYITREYFADSEFLTSSAKKGRFETQPIKTTGYGSQILSLTSQGLHPNQTDTLFYVRGGDNFYEWTETYPEWIPIKDTMPEKKVEGLYVQIAADLYSDGTGEKTPSVSEITLTYLKDEPPQAPVRIAVEAGDGFIDLSWPIQADKSITGYIVYYGEKPSEYFNRETIAVSSISQTNTAMRYRLQNVKNGTLYYIAIAAVARDGQLVGPLSREVYARPMRALQ